MKKYDYVLVGAGLYSGVIAYLAGQAGKNCLVLERRDHTGGNIYCEEIEGIHVHKYGAHIFHTSNKEVWQFVNSLAEFNRYTNSPIANYKGEIYNMPFNMNTFSKMWGIRTPEEAKTIIEEQRKAVPGEPKNLEEQAIKLVGKDIYEKLVKGYTEKQWGRPCTELPSFIIKRLPVRLTFDNNYFNALYQGIPVGGYTKMVANMLGDVEVRLDTDYFEHKEELDALADKVVYTAAAARQKKRLTELGYGNLPICMAKNQYSLSDDPKKLGRPEGFDITIREIYVNAGAGFLVALTGDVMTMPGLPKKPAAEGIDVNDDGVITGLF